MVREEHKKEEGDKPDTAETGPSRLHAPQKRLAVESGKSRLQTSVPGHLRVGGHLVTSTRPHPGAGLDTTESGPPRIVQYRR